MIVRHVGDGFMSAKKGCWEAPCGDIFTHETFLEIGLDGVGLTNEDKPTKQQIQSGRLVPCYFQIGAGGTAHPNVVLQTRRGWEKEKPRR